jgi:hypothetical protein
VARLFRSRIAWFTLASVGISLIVAWIILNPRKFFDNSKPEDLTVPELIDRLADVSEEGVGTHSMAWTTGFIATDDEAQFRGGVLGSKAPLTHPAMRELVRRGVAALPDLLAHISDQRLTKLKVGGSWGMSFGATWQSDEYDYRTDDPKQRPKDVNTGMQNSFRGEYTIRVGDLCYVLVGQIVNRQLSVVRYQPTACLVVNSPVETPALASAARSDWGGLTADQHRDLLTQDAFHESPYAAPAALKRLFFYYPQDAEPIAVKLLSRPLYNYWNVRVFIKGKLIEGQNPEGWRKAIANFTQENGKAAAEVLPKCLHEFVIEKTADRGDEFAAARITVKNVLAAIYPKFDPDHLSFFNAVTEQDHTRLVEALAGISSDNLDNGVIQTFRSINLHLFEMVDRTYADDLAVACMDRLVGKGIDKELVQYCERRIQELEIRQMTNRVDHSLKILRMQLNRIRANN